MPSFSGNRPAAAGLTTARKGKRMLNREVNGILCSKLKLGLDPRLTHRRVILFF